MFLNFKQINKLSIKDTKIIFLLPYVTLIAYCNKYNDKNIKKVSQ